MRTGAILSWSLPLALIHSTAWNMNSPKFAPSLEVPSPHSNRPSLYDPYWATVKAQFFLAVLSPCSPVAAISTVWVPAGSMQVGW
jgi:hypothetical protein